NFSIDIELLEVVQKRNIRLAIPYTIAFIATFYFFREMYSDNLFTLLAPAVIAAALLIRFFVIYPTFKNNLLKWYLIYSFLNGLGWGLVFCLINDFYGAKSIEFLLCG